MTGCLVCEKGRRKNEWKRTIWELVWSLVISLRQFPLAQDWKLSEHRLFFPNLCHPWVLLNQKNSKCWLSLLWLTQESVVAPRPGHPNSLIPSPALLSCVLFSFSVSLCSVHTDAFKDFVGGCCLFQAFQEKSCDSLSPLPWLVVVFLFFGGVFLFFVLNSRLLDFCFNLFCQRKNNLTSISQTWLFSSKVLFSFCCLSCFCSGWLSSW